MCEVACTKKQAACIVGHYFAQLVTICEKCKSLEDGELLLETEDGFLIKCESGLHIEGNSEMSGTPSTVTLTDYGFEFEGDITEIARIREMRCLYSG